MLAIQIRVLAQHRIARDKSAHLRVIIACPDVQQARIAVVAVAPPTGKAVGVGTVAPLSHRVAKGFGCEGARNDLTDFQPF